MVLKSVPNTWENKKKKLEIIKTGNKMENPNQLSKIPSQHHTGQGSVLQGIINPVIGAIWEFPGHPVVTLVSIVRRKRHL